MPVFIFVQSALESAAACVRFAIQFYIVTTVAALILIGSAHADDADDSLRAYAVNIVRHPPESWTGYGVYLGNGFVITAAHVVGIAAITKPSVLIAGLDLPTTVIKEGTLEQVDLTLLSVDKDSLPISVRSRHMSLCEMSPRPGEPVIVAVPEGTARSQIMSPELLPPSLRTNFGTVISDVATTGNSGSGVFDAKHKCLIGIMSRKIQVRAHNDPGGSLKDLAKYFVPASIIRTFIPAESRF
ncbi:MAG TPA: serine protease [Pirellulales bacterium]